MGNGDLAARLADAAFWLSTAGPVLMVYGYGVRRSILRAKKVREDNNDADGKEHIG